MKTIWLSRDLEGYKPVDVWAIEPHLNSSGKCWETSPSASGFVYMETDNCELLFDFIPEPGELWVRTNGKWSKVK